MNGTLLRLLLAVALLLGGIALAQKPVENVNPNRHPSLAAAQRLSEQASEDRSCTGSQRVRHEWPRREGQRTARAGQPRTQASGPRRQTRTTSELTQRRLGTPP
jgi:hypothetical protein